MRSAQPHRVPYFRHRMGNGLFTQFSNMFPNPDFTGVEACRKAVRREIIRAIPMEMNRLGFEPEIGDKDMPRAIIRIPEYDLFR